MDSEPQVQFTLSLYVKLHENKLLYTQPNFRWRFFNGENSSTGPVPTVVGNSNNNSANDWTSDDDHTYSLHRVYNVASDEDACLRINKK